jgi:hypothetical protein
MVAAAGNGLDLVSQEGKVPLPAAAANVIAVGSTDPDGYLSDTSSCNVLKKIYSKPELSATGEGRYIANYGRVSGTSFAAPAVTATIVLLLDGCIVGLNTQELLSHIACTANITVNCSSTIQRLRSSSDLSYVDTITCENTYDPKYGLYYRSGAGRLDISAAIDELYYYSHQPFHSPELRPNATHYLGSRYVPAGESITVYLAMERNTTTYWLFGTQYKSLDMAQIYFKVVGDDGSIITSPYDENYFASLKSITLNSTVSQYYTFYAVCVTDTISHYTGSHYMHN